jgi:hypothetical protein
LAALKDACVCGHDAQVEAVDSYLQESGQLSKGVYHDVLGATVNAKNTTWMGKILDMCPPDTKRMTTENSVRACKFGNVAVVSMAAGALDAINSGSMEHFPLYHAIATGRSEVIGAVLNAGADIYNAVYTSDYSGRTYLHNNPLGYALRLNLPPAAIAYFVERGALVPPVDMCASQRKDRYVVLQAGSIAQTGETMKKWEDAPAGIKAAVKRAAQTRRKADKAAEAERQAGR